MASCTRCNTARAEWLIDDTPHCARRECMIGALRMAPDVVLPYFDRDDMGFVRPCTADLAPFDMANMPAAADTADMLISLWRSDPRARTDVLVAMRTAVLRMLEQQYRADAYAEFARDCVQQARATRAPRLRFLHTGRAVDPAFLALTLASLYVAWIGNQRGLVRAQVQTIDMLLTLSLGAADAAAVAASFYGPLD
jgi:hypothetical protein